MTEQQTITEFITARLDEDHYRAYQAQGLLGIPTPWWTWRHLRNRFGTSITRADALHIERHSPARVLCEVTAKSALLSIHHARDSWGHCMGCGTDSDGSLFMAIDDCPVLRHLAAVHSDHPDYNPAWAVDTT